MHHIYLPKDRALQREITICIISLLFCHLSQWEFLFFIPSCSQLLTKTDTLQDSVKTYSTCKDKWWKSSEVIQIITL